MKLALLGAAVSSLAIGLGAAHAVPNPASAPGEDCHQHPSPLAGQVAGKIEIKSPRFHLSVDYVQGTNDDAAIPGQRPVHYFCTGLPCHPNRINGVGTVVVSGHHFTHPLPGREYGVFYALNQLKRGDVIKVSCQPPFGTGTTRYVVTGDYPVDCGHTVVGFYTCPPAVAKLDQLGWDQNRLDAITCIGSGYQRRIITALAEEKNHS